MFGVRQGASVLVIKDRKDWCHDNFKAHTTKKFNVFDTHELIIDPTGISPTATTAAYSKTIGGAYAKAGYYGFRRDGFSMLVSPMDVEYDGHPVSNPTRIERDFEE